MTQLTIPFPGRTYNAALDGERLTTIQRQVEWLMDNGKWWTLAEIRQALGLPAGCAIDSRIRCMRRCGFKVESRRRTASVWEYRGK